MKSRRGSRIQRSARYGNGLCWFGIFGRLKLLGFISRDKRIQCWTHFPFQVLKKVKKIMDMRRFEILVYLPDEPELWISCILRLLCGQFRGASKYWHLFLYALQVFVPNRCRWCLSKNTIKSAKNSYVQIKCTSF